ncbi:hypothetical protein GOZ80_09905 [Agrobacterium vitis]|uniref:Uncharacterized protein n=1 Tax=Agrobacterium vitis TaxID=373 RepID=A0A6I4EL55_AGRVI|nr:hypothetical protein [Agrobacterium vitis]MUO80227.1 hypothetical protein [Agrobacterium vitis]MUO97372.1 hypothetical protein [Agrobacterium vitis]MUP05265.1 hypothetical protein [Agrobacterium vitis]MUZ73763.1 hypothetical protein [Agrobacterium vitis]MUZ81740.1 hypothetical protein [Agrobacterium vitis]
MSTHFASSPKFEQKPQKPHRELSQTPSESVMWLRGTQIALTDLTVLAVL